MKAKIFLVILILIIVIICYYKSNNNQNSIKNEEKFTDNSAVNPVEAVNLPIYSLSLNNTPYLTYLNTDPNKSSKTSLTIDSHIRFPDSSYVPIKITPFCKFDTIQDQLLFYFLIDRIGDDKYKDYDPKVLEPTQSFNNSKINLPLMTKDKKNIINYKIDCDNQNVENQYMKLKTNNDFMLPYLIDPYEFPNDLNSYKLNDINLSYKLINNDNIDNINSITDNKLVIPKLINSTQTKSLKSLGISLFKFEAIDKNDIDIIYKPAINYTEVYKTTSGIKSYHKINCIQIKINIVNSKYLNLENPDQKLKLKFILQSVTDTNDKDLIYNLEKYPELIYNNETSFNINKGIYQLNFYITDTEYHLIKKNSLQLIACIYSDINIGKNTYPRRLYYEHVLSFNIKKNFIIDRILNENDQDRSNINKEDTLFNDLIETYNVLPTYALNKEIKTSPESVEGFKNIKQKRLNVNDKLDIKKKLIFSRISNVLNYAYNYGLFTVYYKDTDISKKKYQRFINECNVIKEYNKNDKLLNGYIPIKFNKVEKFQEEEDVTKPTNLYTSDNKLILKGITTSTDNLFNTTLDDYMYANTGNDNNTQYNSVRLTQHNYKTVVGNHRHDNGRMFSEVYANKKEKALEYFNGDEGHTLNSDSKISLKYLGPEQLLLAFKTDLKDLKESLNINQDDTINYQFNDKAQTNLYSSNLLFKAQATGNTSTDGIYNKLIIPAEDTYFETDNNGNIPKGFKLNVENHTLHLHRGYRRSHASCVWDSIKNWVFVAIGVLVVLVITGGLAAAGAPGFVAIVSGTAIASKAIIAVKIIKLISEIVIIAVSIHLASKKSSSTPEIKHKLENYVLEVEKNITDDFDIKINNIGKIYDKINLNFKNKAATAENFINIKAFLNTKDNKLIEHPFATEKNKGNESFNDPTGMHVGGCTLRNDLLTIRRFKDSDGKKINVIPMSVNGKQIGSINYYKQGHNDNNSQYQHASPSKDYIDIFTYMNHSKDNTDQYNSYIDLSDADISINDFGGLNYYEIYKNYYKEDQSYISGIINMVDGSGKYIDFYRRDHGHGDLTSVNFIDDYNHISANHKYIEEYKLFYNTMLEPYNIKVYSDTYRRLLQLLHNCGSNQILLSESHHIR